VSLQELQIYSLWAGKQTAKGTPNTAPAKRFKQISGDFNIPRADGNQKYGDATASPGNEDWVDTLVGNGNPGILATPEELAWLLWAQEGGETTAAVTGPPAKTKHTVVPLPGLGHVCTFVTRKGSQVAERMQHNDSYISQSEIGGSTGSKAVRITPTVLSLDPGEQRAADPAAAMPTKATMLYTDGASRFSVDGTTFTGHSEFTATVAKELTPVYGDSENVEDLAIAATVVGIGVTLYMNATGKAQLYKLLYGTPTPAAGQKPQRVIGPLGSYLFDLRARDTAGVANGDKFVFTLAGVKWQIPDAPDPNPEGGTPTYTLQGEAREVGSTPLYQTDIDCDAAAFTV